MRRLFRFPATIAHACCASAERFRPVIPLAGLTLLLGGLHAEAGASPGYGCVNEAGLVAIGIRFEDTRPFVEGCAAVKLDSHWGMN